MILHDQSPGSGVATINPAKIPHALRPRGKFFATVLSVDSSGGGRPELPVRGIRSLEEVGGDIHLS